jgi:hypothetical protein
VTLAVNPLNELADATFVPIANPELVADHVKTAAATAASSLKVTVAPNPATSNITITYNLPAAGIVNMSIVTNKGVIVGTPLVTNTNMAAGTYTLPWNVSGLAAGQYYVNLSQTVGGKTKTATFKFVKQ